MKVTHSKTDEAREVEINQTAREPLEELVEAAKMNEYNYLFTNTETGKPYTTINTAFAAARREAQLVDFRFHDLRHCFASAAGDDPTVSVSALAETLGHKNWRTTMRYTHAAKKAKMRVVEAVERRQKNKSGHITVTQEEGQVNWRPWGYEPVLGLSHHLP